MPISAKQITKETLKAEVLLYKNASWRFVTATCVDLNENEFDLLYHFDKDNTMEHLRLTVPKKEPVPSVSDVYLAAFLVENEIQDQFGLCFDGLALNFANHLYLDDEVATTPFCKFGVVRKTAAAE
ncbi:NADH-quinone oxidoreductase subunit C [Megalodesulfovibrio paquesii]